MYLGCGAQPPAQLHVDEEAVQQIKQDQEKLRWNQIYYGHITCAWAHSLTTSQNTINGIVFYSRVIILIWQAVIAQWKVSNQHQHPPNRTEEDCTQLECRVYQIIQEAQADPNMQELITSVNPNVLLNRPIKHIRHWITNSKNHMQAQQKVASIWASLHMQDIWTFFQRPPTYRNKIPQRKIFYAPLRKSYISSVGLRKL